MQPTHSSRRILRPVRGGFILFTLTVAAILNLIPSGHMLGVPDWVALVLAFWSVREPLKVGMATGFVLGLIMDVSYGSVLGEHPLGYVLVAYLGSGLSRRVLWFPLLQQAVHILPILLAMQVVMVVARMIGGAVFPGWSYFLSSFSAAILWMPLNYLLLLPQLRPEAKDDNRPI